MNCLCVKVKKTANKWCFVSKTVIRKEKKKKRLVMAGYPCCRGYAKPNTFSVFSFSLIVFVNYTVVRIKFTVQKEKSVKVHWLEITQTHTHTHKIVSYIQIKPPIFLFPSRFSLLQHAVCKSNLIELRFIPIIHSPKG